MTISENTTDSQAGIGFGLGIGGKFHHRNFTFFINPNFKKHAVIPFEKEVHQQRLTQFGLQFGVGFVFQTSSEEIRVSLSTDEIRNFRKSLS